MVCKLQAYLEQYVEWHVGHALQPASTTTERAPAARLCGYDNHAGRISVGLRPGHARGVVVGEGPEPEASGLGSGESESETQLGRREW